VRIAVCGDLHVGVAEALRDDTDINAGLLHALDVDHAALRRQAGELARPPGRLVDRGHLPASAALVAAVAAAERERLLLGAPHLTATLLLAGLVAEGGEVVEPLTASGVSARVDAILAELGPLIRPHLSQRRALAWAARSPGLLGRVPWWGRRRQPDRHLGGNPGTLEVIVAMGPAATVIADDLMTSTLPTRMPREATTVTQALYRMPPVDTERLPAPPSVRVDNDRVVLDATAWRGGGEFRIRNDTGLDAVVVLTTLARRPVRAIAVRSGDVATMRHIADGPYLLYFTMGTDWDPSRRRFTEPSTNRRFTEPLMFWTSGSLLWGNPTFSTYEVTLHPVERGNAPVQPVPAAEFPSLR
jgi:hypothetical protein